MLAAVDASQDAVIGMRREGTNWYLVNARLDQASSALHEAELTIVLKSGPDAAVLEVAAMRVVKPLQEFRHLVQEGKRPEADAVAVEMGDGILDLRKLVYRALEAERNTL